MEESLYREMFALEGSHWWFTARHEIVQNLLRRFMRSSLARPRIGDLGCGCGKLLTLLAADYDAVGMDPSPLAVEFARQRGATVQLGGLDTPIPWPTYSFDAVLMLDVLEHLDDDHAAVRAAARLLRHDGILLCTVPACPWLWTEHDERHHHRRRYTKTSFGKLFQQPGLDCELLSYFNTWLFPLAVLKRLSSRLFKSAGAGSDLVLPSRGVNAALHRIFASEQRVLGRLPLPIGLSLIAVVRKTAASEPS